MSDATPIPPASERERFEADARPYGFDLTRDENTTGEPWCDYKDHDTGHRWGGWLAALEPHQLPVGAALSHPSTPQGWKQIGWTCVDGDCGRIHEAPGAEGSYAVRVYVQCPPDQGGKG